MNRIAKELELIRQRELAFMEQLGPGFQQSKVFQRHKAHQLRELFFKYRYAGKSPDERNTLLMVSAQIDAMNQQRRMRLPRGILGLVIAAVRFPFQVVIGLSRLSYRTIKGIRDLQAMNRAERENIDGLNGQLTKMGFGTQVPLLDIANTRGKDQIDFPLSMHKSDGHRMDVTLHLERQNGQLMFPYYDARVKNLQNGHSVQRQFRVSDGEAFHPDEAYQLLKGRAVNRQYVGTDGTPASTWYQLDFQEKDQRGNYRLQQYGDDYGFDLRKALDAHPFEELKDPGARALIAQKLQAGGQVEVHLRRHGKTERYTIEADPAQKSLRILDAEKKQVRGADLFQPRKFSVQQKLKPITRVPLQIRRNGKSI